MIKQLILPAALAALVASSACSKQTRVERGVKKEQPRTPEELGEVVVDENGQITPVTRGEASIAPALDQGRTSPGDSKILPKEGTPPCANQHCFTIEDWSLDFGQTYVQTIAKNPEQSTPTSVVTTTVIDGFENPRLTQLQSICLSETAKALKEYAFVNPESMKSFADAGISTTFAARVYDTTASSNAVSANLYFIKGSDGTSGGVSMSRGKWVIRSAITGAPGQDDCQILTPEQITAKLEFWKAQLLK